MGSVIGDWLGWRGTFAFAGLVVLVVGAEGSILGILVGVCAAAVALAGMVLALGSASSAQPSHEP
jgi:hypothetical protein